MSVRLALAATLAVVALPAASNAADYYDRYGRVSGWGGDPCAEVREGRQAVGAVVGGIVGGVIGHEIGSDNNNGGGRHHHRGRHHGYHHGGGDGAAATAIGAIVGAAIGAGIANDTVDCGQRRDYRYEPGYQQAGWGYVETPYGYEAGSGYGGEDYGYSYPSDDGLYGGPSGASSGDVAGEECETVMQVTTLPDGTEIHRPTQACRNTYYGDWEVRE